MKLFLIKYSIASCAALSMAQSATFYREEHSPSKSVYISLKIESPSHRTKTDCLDKENFNPLSNSPTSIGCKKISIDAFRAQIQPDFINEMKPTLSKEIDQIITERFGELSEEVVNLRESAEELINESKESVREEFSEQLYERCESLKTDIDKIDDKIDAIQTDLEADLEAGLEAITKKTEKMHDDAIARMNGIERNAEFEESKLRDLDNKVYDLEAATEESTTILQGQIIELQKQLNEMKQMLLIQNAPEEIMHIPGQTKITEFFSKKSQTKQPPKRTITEYFQYLGYFKKPKI
jgi:uncharacterized protein YqgV (UPF0045/DUF77 family)